MSKHRSSIHTQPNSPKIPTYFERSYFEYLNRSQWRKYPNLGSVLNAQLRFQEKITRCTQTNWKWRKMVERWGHAKVIAPADVLRAEELVDKMRDELILLRKVTPNDKITDTSDLDYDPYDLNMVYTQRTSMAFPRKLSKRMTLAPQFDRKFGPVSAIAKDKSISK